MVATENCGHIKRWITQYKLKKFTEPFHSKYDPMDTEHKLNLNKMFKRRLSVRSFYCQREPIRMTYLTPY